jgi:hypothetical protein
MPRGDTLKRGKRSGLPTLGELNDEELLKNAISFLTQK